jgi:pseudaminic acid cytidylyltransferase
LIAIIPARGGSKRIPRKNIKLFHGKPIIAYSIEAALQSGLFDEVIVSTDDKEIAEIAQQYGAKVPFLRSKKNSDDFATTIDVIVEVMNFYKDKGIEHEFICCIYPCAVFVSKEKIQEAYNLLNTKNFDTVLPIIEYGFPIQRALKIENEKTVFSSPEFIKTRSQDLEKHYHDAGQFYWLRTNIILQEHTIFTSNTGSIVISELEAQDIDTETDWKLAELKFKMIHDDIS